PVEPLSRPLFPRSPLDRLQRENRPGPLPDFHRSLLRYRPDSSEPLGRGYGWIYPGQPRLVVAGWHSPLFLFRTRRPPLPLDSVVGFHHEETVHSGRGRLSLPSRGALARECGPWIPEPFSRPRQDRLHARGKDRQHLAEVTPGPFCLRFAIYS